MKVSYIFVHEQESKKNGKRGCVSIISFVQYMRIALECT